jgi:predicted dehydrogenase
MTVNGGRKTSINVAICGLGRIGRYHSMNIVERIRKMNLIAGCSIHEADRKWAEEHLGPYGVTIYADYNEVSFKWLWFFE